MNGRFRAIILAATSAAFCFASVASAEKPDDKEKKGKPRQVIDTGVDLMPPDASAEATLDRMTSRSSEGLVLVEHPNGMLSMDLDGRFMNVMLATPLADGSAHLSCQAGAHAHKTATPPPALKTFTVLGRAQKLEEK
jgi:hypothetical protein